MAGVDGVPLYDQRGEGIRPRGRRPHRHGSFRSPGSSLAADFDKDGDVDGADFLVWQTNFFTPTGATPNDGDADGDGDVDGEDFLIWQLEFAGESTGAGAAGLNELDRPRTLSRADRVRWELPAGQDHEDPARRTQVQDEVLAGFKRLWPHRRLQGKLHAT